MPQGDVEGVRERARSAATGAGQLQQLVADRGLKVCALFEGRDAAGKGGKIKRIMDRTNPRVVRVVALQKPTEAECGQWYLQRYVAQLPSAGEIVLFDRSWYNRAGVGRGWASAPRTRM